MQFLVIGWNLGYQVSFQAVLADVVVWMFTIVGYSAYGTHSIAET